MKEDKGPIRSTKERWTWINEHAYKDAEGKWRCAKTNAEIVYEEIERVVVWDNGTRQYWMIIHPFCKECTLSPQFPLKRAPVAAKEVIELVFLLQPQRAS